MQIYKPKKTKDHKKSGKQNITKKTKKQKRINTPITLTKMETYELSKNAEQSLRKLNKLYENTDIPRDARMVQHMLISDMSK